MLHISHKKRSFTPARVRQSHSLHSSLHLCDSDWPAYLSSHFEFLLYSLSVFNNWHVHSSACLFFLSPACPDFLYQPVCISLPGSLPVCLHSAFCEKNFFRPLLFIFKRTRFINLKLFWVISLSMWFVPFFMPAAEGLSRVKRISENWKTGVDTCTYKL